MWRDGYTAAIKTLPAWGMGGAYLAALAGRGMWPEFWGCLALGGVGLLLGMQYAVERGRRWRAQAANLKTQVELATHLIGQMELELEGRGLCACTDYLHREHGRTGG